MKRIVFFSKREYVTTLILRTVGNFLILSSLFIIGKTLYQPVAAEIKYFQDRWQNKSYVVASKEEAPRIIREFRAQESKRYLGKAVENQKVEVLVPADPQFSIVIPAIGANARVVSNVDTSNREVYLEALQNGVAHADGTTFPGESGHIFLFAHSTDYFWNVGQYNAVFYLLYKLQLGDEINLFYKGQRHLYKVHETKIVNPSEVSYLTRKTNHEVLTLQTCWPPGTTLQRLLIFAEPVTNGSDHSNPIE